MEIDRRAFIASLGGTAAVALMTSEEKADALEHYMEERLDELALAQQGGSTPPSYPTMAEIAAADAQALRVAGRSLMREAVGGEVDRRECNGREFAVGSGVELDRKPPALGINAMFHH